LIIYLSYYQSFHTQKPTSSKSVKTIADGIAVKVASKINLPIMLEYVDDVLQVNDEEIAAEQDKNMPFLLENELLKNKASYIKASEWADHIEVDENIITGQNPQSSESVAKAIIQKLES